MHMVNLTCLDLRIFPIEELRSQYLCHCSGEGTGIRAPQIIHWHRAPRMFMIAGMLKHTRVCPQVVSHSLFSYRNPPHLLVIFFFQSLPQGRKKHFTVNTPYYVAMRQSYVIAFP